MAGASTGTKRLRLSLPEQRTGALQVIERKSPTASNDLINYFAERGTRAQKLQRENSESQGEIARLQNLLKTADLEISSLKARPQQELSCYAFVKTSWKVIESRRDSCLSPHLQAIRGPPKQLSK